MPRDKEISFLLVIYCGVLSVLALHYLSILYPQLNIVHSMTTYHHLTNQTNTDHSLPDIQCASTSVAMNFYGVSKICLQEPGAEFFLY
jgi:hypothetical protein